MDPVRSFLAPWSRLLVIMTLIGSVVLLGVPVMMLSAMPTDDLPRIAIIGMVLFFPLLLGIMVLFSIRSFDIMHDGILVRRLLWANRLAYEDLRSVRVDEDAMKGSIRVMGNGGLFSFSGKYRSRKLGVFTVYATDMKLSVILRYSDRTVVVTPESPEEFADLVRQFSSAL